MKKGKLITIQTEVNAPIEKVWNCWTIPEHITKWNFATPEWHCPAAENDLKVGSTFIYNMAAKDGSFDFDFKGKYTEIVLNKQINYDLEDRRKVSISFEKNGDVVLLKESFEAEGTNADEMQKAGWQAILENFKNYVEA